MSLNVVKLFISGSQFFIDTKLAEQLSKFSEDDEIHSYYGDELDSETFFNTLFTHSLFAENKVIVVRKAEGIKKLETFILQLLRATDVSIILATTDGRAATSFQKQLKGSDFIISVEEKSSTSGNIDEIRTLFKAKGFDIPTNIASGIGAKLLWDMAEVANEAEKMELYFYGREGVRAQEILEHISGEPQEIIFRFIDLFMERQKRNCLKVYYALPNPDNISGQIFNMLIMYAASLYFKLTNPQLNDTKNPLFNGKSYFIRTVNNTYRKWNAADATNLIRTMAELDLKIKTGRISMPDAVIALIGTL